MNIIIGLYLVGYLLSFGMIIGLFKKFDFDVFMVALCVSIFSWVIVGYAFSDLILPADKKIE